MWSFIEDFWDLVCFEWCFGQTGRLIIKTLSFGQTDLDLDRLGQCFLAVVVGLMFWAALALGLIWWRFPQLFSYLSQLSGFS